MQQAIGRYRWTICGLLFFATTVNYLDRQVLSLLQPYLADPKNFNWTNTDYANITAMFQFVYALSMLFAGRIIDKLGTKKGYGLAIIIWSLAAIIHAFAIPIGQTMSAILGWVGITSFSVSVLGFMFSRAVLAFGEAGNFPAAIKATAEYFPKKRKIISHRCFQFRIKCRRNSGSVDRSLDQNTLGLAMGIYHNGDSWFCMVILVVFFL